MNESYKNARILIIDDQPANTELLFDFLQMMGYSEVITLSDSREAMKTILDFKPELILLDLMMPHFSGFDVMNQLKEANLFSPLLPILVLTADASEKIKQKALEEGAKDFLTKPYNLAEVNLRINNLLQGVYLMNQLQFQNFVLEERVANRTQELTESLQKIKLQNEALKEIAWEQSHLVRAPLARLMGIVQVLDSEYEDADFNMQQWVEYAISACAELDDIIKQITLKSSSAGL
ncbi:MAG: response regulator [Bacteroidia bacterium]|nr:response regulator [Bacteroidia bacterium]MCF8428171.1 response regulator [Bacteroidia bacterium]MCF8445435.1 response regulator [Bacteroidia bacterium]